jgi:hypothetical protein
VDLTGIEPVTSSMPCTWSGTSLSKSLPSAGPAKVRGLALNSLGVSNCLPSGPERRRA